MKMILKAPLCLMVLLTTACTLKDLKSADCDSSILTKIELGERIPELSKQADFRIMTTPSNFSVGWDYWECGVYYMLGEHSSGKIEYVSTSDETVLTNEGVQVGMSYSEAKTRTETDSFYARGWAHVLPLDGNWNAAFSVIDEELSPESTVSFLFKGTLVTPVSFED